MKNALFLGNRVTVRSQEPIAKRAIFIFRRTVATIIIICAIIDCIVIKLVKRKGPKAFQN